MLMPAASLSRSTMCRSVQRSARDRLPGFSQSVIRSVHDVVRESDGELVAKHGAAESKIHAWLRMSADKGYQDNCQPRNEE